MQKIVAVEPLQEYKLRVRFADGEEKVVNAKPYLEMGIGRILLDESLFRKVSIESGGGIFWPNGFDFCPNYLYDEVSAVVETPL